MVSVSPLQRISVTTGLTAVRPITPAPPVGPATKAEEILPLEAPPALARGGAATAAAATPDLPQALTPQVQKLATAATQAAVVRQAGMAPLLADLAEAARRPDLPPAVRAAAAQVLAQRAPLTPALQGADVQEALARSGLLMEARAVEGAAPALQSDLKAALLVLRQALQGLVDTTAAPPRPAHATAKAPPPPFRGGPTAGQAAAPADLPPEPGPAARRLLDETEGALARQQLMQLASLPQAPDASGPSTRWLFEVPFATPQGSAVAQFEIARDPPPAGAPDADPTWRARFSLDLASLGPLHAHLSLSGSHLGVALWAEHEAGLAALRSHQPALTKALLAARLSPDIAIYPGQPASARPAPGRFLDQAT